MKKLFALLLFGLLFFILAKGGSPFSPPRPLEVNGLAFASEEATTFGQIIQSATPTPAATTSAQIIRQELQRTAGSGLKGFLASPLFAGFAFLVLVFGLILFLKRY